MRRRRIALEWGLILTVGVVLALSTLTTKQHFIADVRPHLRDAARLYGKFETSLAAG